MRGLSKINSIQDIENNLAVDPEKTKAMIQEILDNRFIWTVDKTLSDPSEFTKSNNTKLLESQDENGNIIYYQIKQIEDPNSIIFRIGSTPRKLNNFLK